MKKKIQAIIVEMRNEVILCNIEANCYDNLLCIIETSNNEEELNDFYTRILDIYNDAYTNQKKARNAVSADVWRQYDLLQVTGLWEQNNLYKTSKKLRTAIRRLIHETTKQKTIKKTAKSSTCKRDNRESNLGSSS